jgi:hypothetical protein
MRTNILELLDCLSRTGVDMTAMQITTEDSDVEFGGTLKNFIGVIGEKSNEKVRKGMYLYSDAFDNDAELMNMADEIYNHENGDNTKILYFEIG